jgi:hypothetical protein
VKEEERKVKEQEVKTSKQPGKLLEITSFILSLFSFTIMLFFWIVILIEMSHGFFGVSEFWYNVNDILGAIVFLLFPPAILFAFPALVLVFFAYYKTKE